MSKYPPIYYSDYLQLDNLLNSQKPKSEEYGFRAHEEMLFIIVHQAYELWFKQILHEVDSINQMFTDDVVDEKSIGIAVSRLGRVTEIQKLLIEQLRVLETMTPLDFLEFRDFLIPASGFQSFQFRLIENKLGLSDEKRIQYNNVDYLNTLEEPHRKLIMETVKQPSLFELVQKWLERTPFLNSAGFNFWQSYKQAVDRMLEQDRNIILENNTLTEKKREFQLKQLELTRENYESLFDETKYNVLLKEGKRHLSNRSMLAAIFINLYRDEPILHLPFMLLNRLVEIDELFTTWRYRHALMVHRMIGSKIGTGGSSGHQYLMSTVDKHRIFIDLFNLSTYLIPRSELPKLPEELKKELGFSFRSLATN
ncbi:MAG: tryptophan 2,3-dioxygenase [Ignavibacteria bacterium]|nr:tryptophan 2,3-dioxygenase [Ignavibacteria bacterium]MCC7158972.1 tryptophan 2,3-dioxygenase [Ignavibacteria bacterium]